MDKMSNWEKNEARMFRYLKETYIPDLEYSDLGEYSPYDCYSKDKSCEIELKFRHKHYPTLMIEKMKYDKLMTRALAHDTEAIYISETPDGIFAFNLSRLNEPQWFTKKLPATSNFDRREWIDKEVANIDVKLGKQI